MARLVGTVWAALDVLAPDLAGDDILHHAVSNLYSPQGLMPTPQFQSCCTNILHLGSPGYEVLSSQLPSLGRADATAAALLENSSDSCQQMIPLMMAKGYKPKG